MNSAFQNAHATSPAYTGIHPHLTHRNYDPEHASECSIAVVVPWAGKLWTITYPGHKPLGSVDKLRAIDEHLQIHEFEGSVGGTHANRFIHRESNQLIIGLHFIDAEGNIRTIQPADMPGRQTAVARHLTDPENKVYFYEMEGALYEVDVHTLAVTRLFKKPVPGWHGKGACSGQGRLVIANNGDRAVPGVQPEPFEVEDLPESPDRAGALAEWDGEAWHLLERIQHCEVTGPGGLYGNASADDPIWCTGFDQRSVLLQCLDRGVWHTYRLPKGSYTHDGRHGWHTEWPRIREIEPGFLLMHMHGLLWDFPKTFAATSSAGLTPIASYHKMMVDYCSWNGTLVMACNDTTVFGNPLVTQPQSNLRFLEREDLSLWGPRAGFGGPLVEDDLTAGEASVPYLLAGFKHRVLHLTHGNDSPRTFVLEVDAEGTGAWSPYQEQTVEPGRTTTVILPTELEGEWMRVVAGTDSKAVTAYLIYSDERPPADAPLCAGIAEVGHDGPLSAGIIRPFGSDLKSLQFLAVTRAADGSVSEMDLEVTTDLAFQPSAHPDKDAWFREKGAVEAPDFEVDAASVIVRDSEGTAYRLPKGDARFDSPFDVGIPRGRREVVTERSLWNCHGTFYELPRDNSGGVPKLQPVCTHNRLITDYCSWQGMLVIAGVCPEAENGAHLIRSEEHGASLWLGDVDDLWRFGKPVGTGGPWKETTVEPGAPSDPYLMLGYDKKSVTLSHDCGEPVSFTLEIDPTATGAWSRCLELSCPAEKSLTHHFPQGFSSHWIRVKADRACTATCTFVYA